MLVVIAIDKQVLARAPDESRVPPHLIHVLRRDLVTLVFAELLVVDRVVDGGVHGIRAVGAQDAIDSTA